MKYSFAKVISILLCSMLVSGSLIASEKYRLAGVIADKIIVKSATGESLENWENTFEYFELWVNKIFADKITAAASLISGIAAPDKALVANLLERSPEMKQRCGEILSSVFDKHNFATEFKKFVMPLYKNEAVESNWFAQRSPQLLALVPQQYHNDLNSALARVHDISRSKSFLFVEIMHTGCFILQQDWPAIAVAQPTLASEPQSQVTQISESTVEAQLLDQAVAPSSCLLL